MNLLTIGYMLTEATVPPDKFFPVIITSVAVTLFIAFYYQRYRRDLERKRDQANRPPGWPKGFPT